MNESFWDAHGAEIGARAIFEHLAGSDKFCQHDNKNVRLDSLGSSGGVIPWIVRAPIKPPSGELGFCR